jgi:hypothetical protein
VINAETGQMESVENQMSELDRECKVARKRSGLVPSRMKVASAVASLALLFVSHTNACSFAEGIFHQVTALKGRVVGTTFHGLPRWWRQSIARKHAKLALYEYRWPRAAWDDGSLIKTTETDDRGHFDFGSLRMGHYTLRIDDNDLFDVEVKDLPRVTDSVTIDVSPVSPDCTGGHEFIVRGR